MTKREIDRFGVMSYAALILGVINGFLQDSPALRNNFLVIIPLFAVNLVGVSAVLYCLGSFISHLLTENQRVRGFATVGWLVLLVFGNLVTMPIYWYWYIVREHMGETAGRSRELSDVTPASQDLPEPTEGARPTKQERPGT